MSDFEQWWRERQLKSWTYADKPMPDGWGDHYKPKAKQAWNAAIASMQGEAVAWVSEASLQTLEAGRDAIAGDKNGLRVHPLFTHAPASSARIAEQDAKIKELEQQLEAARKDAERYQWLKEHARTIEWFVEDEDGKFEYKRPHLDSAIDAAIRQIGGAE